MCYWVFTKTGRVIARSTVQPIADADIKTKQVILELKAFVESIQTILSSESDNLEDIEVPDYLRYMCNQDDQEIETPHYDPVEPEAVKPEANELNNEEYDKYIAAEVVLPKGDSFMLGKVMGQKRDAEDNLISVGHTNTIFDT